MSEEEIERLRIYLEGSVCTDNFLRVTKGQGLSLIAKIDDLNKEIDELEELLTNLKYSDEVARS